MSSATDDDTCKTVIRPRTHTLRLARVPSSLLRSILVRKSIDNYCIINHESLAEDDAILMRHLHNNNGHRRDKREILPAGTKNGPFRWRWRRRNFLCKFSISDGRGGNQFSSAKCKSCCTDIQTLLWAVIPSLFSFSVHLPPIYLP